MGSPPAAAASPSWPGCSVWPDDSAASADALPQLPVLAALAAVGGWRRVAVAAARNRRAVAHAVARLVGCARRPAEYASWSPSVRTASPRASPACLDGGRCNFIPAPGAHRTHCRLPDAVCPCGALPCASPHSSCVWDYLSPRCPSRCLPPPDPSPDYARIYVRMPSPAPFCLPAALQAIVLGIRHYLMRIGNAIDAACIALAVVGTGARSIARTVRHLRVRVLCVTSHAM